jgi:hypothetical protein
MYHAVFPLDTPCALWACNSYTDTALKVAGLFFGVIARLVLGWR